MGFVAIFGGSSNVPHFSVALAPCILAVTKWLVICSHQLKQKFAALFLFSVILYQLVFVVWEFVW